MRNRKNLLRMIFAALSLALSYVMPFLTGQIPQIGSMLCPMHIPVLLCGFICGWQWGLVVGFVAPLLRALTLNMPPLFPAAVCMAFELATYGAVAGLMNKFLPRKKPFIFCSLLGAMTVGRIVYGIAMFIALSTKGSGYTMRAFIMAAFVNATPGIIIQILLIPPLVMLLDNPKVLRLNE